MAKGVYERKPRPCPTREKLLQYIILFREDHGYSPSIREMATAVGVRSTCTISQHLVFLEESGLITSDTMGSRTMIRITKEGQETLRFFENELNPEIRRQCAEFLRRNGMEIRDEAKTSAKYYKKVTGDYEVDLTVNERDTTLCALRLDVPDESIAKTVTQNWLEKNEDIYQYLVKELF